MIRPDILVLDMETRSLDGKAVVMTIGAYYGNIYSDNGYFHELLEDSFHVKLKVDSQFALNRIED